MVSGVSLAGYQHLVDWFSRLIRPGKANLSSTVPETLTRLGVDTDSWKETLQRLLGPNKKIGSYFGNTNRLNEVATQRGCKYLKNISGRDIPLHAPGASSLS